MYNHYCINCKNCNNIVGKWNIEYKWYKANVYCKFIESKNINSIYFLDCKKCNKFVGIYCLNVCNNCFGENQIFGEENLFNWFFKYKKIITLHLNLNINIFCKNCNKYDFRRQYWFFEELTFIKIIIK